MKDAREIIIRPIITEHSYDMMARGVYTFEVAKDANKIEIRKAVEEIFNVKVTKVNVLNVKPKPKQKLPPSFPKPSQKATLTPSIISWVKNIWKPIKKSERPITANWF